MVTDLRSNYDGDLDETLVNLSNYELNVLRAILEASDATISEALEIIEDEMYMFYETDSFDEFIDTLIDEEALGEISPNLVFYLDYDKIRTDLELDGYTLTSVGVIRID